MAWFDVRLCGLTCVGTMHCDMDLRCGGEWSFNPSLSAQSIPNFNVPIFRAMEAARDRSRSRSHSPTEEYDTPGLAALYAKLQRDFNTLQGDFNQLQDILRAQRRVVLLHEQDIATLRLQVATRMSSR